LLNVYHDIIGAAQHRAGAVWLLVDIESLDIYTMEESRETNVQCGHCFATFPSLHALRFV
jgi:hypothetical protein